jgi:hypothetical protein
MPDGVCATELGSAVGCLLSPFPPYHSSNRMHQSTISSSNLR